MNQYDRRNRILEILSHRKKISVDSLSDEFKVSRRTIEHDIEILSIDYPIKSQTGCYGGISVDDNWKFEHKYLNSEEIEVLNKFKNNPRCSKKDRNLLNSILNRYSAPWIKSGS